MTALEIIRLTLDNINEDTDEQTVEEYRETILRWVNDAYLDICARRYQPRKVAQVTVADGGAIPASQLPNDLVRICAIRGSNGGPLVYTPKGSLVKVYGYSGVAELEYVYRPAELVQDADTPILPLTAHTCLADYAAWRLLATGSSARQARGAVFYECYQKSAGRIDRQGFEPPAMTGRFVRA